MTLAEEHQKQYAESSDYRQACDAIVADYIDQKIEGLRANLRRLTEQGGERDRLGMIEQRLDEALLLSCGLPREKHVIYMLEKHDDVARALRAWHEGEGHYCSDYQCCCLDSLLNKI